MSSEWKDYSRDRKIRLHERGFYVIKPARAQSSGIPIFCPHCGSIMNSIYDDETFKKFDCCDWCAATWVYKDIENWKSGWRPQRDDVEKKLQLK